MPSPLVALALIVAFGAPRAGPHPGRALGEEEFGNEPVAVNAEWAEGLLAVANDPHRLYRRWVDGNEEFFFAGDTQAVNAALARFARIEAEVREVVLLPGPGLTRSFEGQPVDHGWRLYAPSGITLAMARTAQASAFPAYAVLSVYVAGAIELAHLSIPSGVLLLGHEDLAERYRAAGATRDEFQKASAAHTLRELEARTRLESGDEMPGLEALDHLIHRARGVELELEFDAAEHAFSAALVNRRSLPVTLVLPGDGSEPGLRTPRLRWTIVDARSGEDRRTGWIGCGTIDPLRAEEVVTLGPGERRPIPVSRRLWTAGRYRVVLHYDSDPARGLPEGQEAPDVLALVRSSERLVLASRPIEVTVP